MQVGVASSTKAESRLAAREAAALAAEQARGVSLGFVFFPAERDAADVALGVADSLKDHPFIGHSTSFQMTPSGLFYDAVSILVINSPHIRLGVGIGTGLDEDAKSAGRTAVTQALKQLKPGSPPALVSSHSMLEGIRSKSLTCIMFTAPPQDKTAAVEEGVIEGIAELTQGNLEIIGSTAVGVPLVGESIIQQPKVIANGKAHANSVACGIMASNVSISLAMGHGFKPTPKIAVVSRVSGNTVFELNGKPALKTYAELTGVSEEETRSHFSLAPFHRKSALNRYSFGVMDSLGEYWLRTPRYAGENDALVFDAGVKPGAVMLLMQTDEARTLSSVSKVAETLAGDRATTDFGCCLGFIPSSHRLILGDLSKEYALLKTVWGSTPFLLASSAGEQGPASTATTWHTDMACIGILFGNDSLMDSEKLSAVEAEHYPYEGGGMERRVGTNVPVQATPADIQVSLMVYNRHPKVGEEILVEIELSNVGNAPVRLVRIENLLSPNLLLKNRPEGCTVEGDVLNIRGRIVNPMKTEGVKLTVSPLHRGELQLKPRIFYLDLAGSYHHHDSNPIPIVVRELGLKGWLRGPPK